jgi:hypothetical protein
VPFGLNRRREHESIAAQRPPGVSRGQWQQQLRDSATPLTDPVPGLADYGRSAGWSAPSVPPLDDSALGFAHDMLMKLEGVVWQADPNTDPGGGPSRYADTYTGTVDGREFVVSNVSYTWSFLHGGEHPVAGALCSIKLDCVLPLLFVNPRGCQPHMRAMTKPVKLGRADFDHTFEVRSGHVDYAASLLTPMADEILVRDDWALFLEFANLVSITARPFRTVDEVIDRISAMSRIVGLIPASVRDAYQVNLPPQRPDAVELSEDDRRRARQIIETLPADQRRALVGRMRAEGPDAVVRELLGSNDGRLNPR